MLKQASFVSSVVLFVFAGQMALAGPVLDIDPDLMGLPRSGIVVDRQPFPTGGPGSDTSFFDVATPLTSQLSADDFMIDSATTIRHVTWWGFYGGTFTNPAEQPPATQTMRIRFYGARALDNLPGSVLFEESVIDPPYAWTGRQILTGATPNEYRFDVNLTIPAQLNSSTLYWLEIVQVGSQQSVYRWEYSVSGRDGFAFQNDATVDWVHTQNTAANLAFQLSTIPEPSTAALMLVLCCCFSCRGGRKGAQRWVGNRTGEDIRMLRQASVASCVIVVVFAGQMASAGPVLDIDPDLMGLPRGGIVVDQQPNLTGGQGSDTSFINGVGVPFWQLLADNIRLGQSATIRQITWWGFYGGDFDEAPDAHDPPTGPESFRVRLYAPRTSDDLPDSSNILFEETILNPPRASTGRTLLLPGIPDEYRYQAELSAPFLLDADLLYWLEVVQLGDLDSHFRWERGTGLQLGFYYLNPVVSDWTSSPGSFAFELSTIPEPGTGGLLLICVPIAVRLLGHGGRRVPPR
ncbi:MAG: hypothetical protein IT419_03700 [Planctomycetes bacterium]|jgi:hypothetical protein|nr:hypothetical protein [Planctomycetota bacterium]